MAACVNTDHGRAELIQIASGPTTGIENRTSADLTSEPARQVVARCIPPLGPASSLTLINGNRLGIHALNRRARNLGRRPGRV